MTTKQGEIMSEKNLVTRVKFLEAQNKLLIDCLDSMATEQDKIISRPEDYVISTGNLYKLCTDEESVEYIWGKSG